MNSLRVRQILPNLDYQVLVEAGIIPSNVFVEKVPVKSVPLWSLKYPDRFGLYIEELVRKAIELDDVGKWEKLLLPLYHEYFPKSKKVKPPSLEDKVVRGFFFAIWHFVQKELKQYCEDATFEVELEVGNVQGHPDIVTSNIIFDVKTTRNFDQMREETVLQLLSYASLMNQKGYKVPLIGVILPIQKMILFYDLRNWDSSTFFEHINARVIDICKAARTFRYNYDYVGNHVGKEATLLATCTNYAHLQRFQLFLSSPRKAKDDTGICKFSEEDIKATKAFISKNKLKVYIHSPYYINLSKPTNLKSKGEDGSWCLKILKHQLQVAASFGAKGVVVHLGSHEDVNLGMKVMRESVIEMAKHATDACPLLLETNAGEGNDLCCELEELIEFYSTLPLDTKKTVKLCVDTCHVHSVGYCPLFFLQKLIERFGADTIPLIHYNDSQCCKGAHKDRHERIGHGKIGICTLVEVLILARQYGISLVVE